MVKSLKFLKGDPTLLRKDYNNAVTSAEALDFWAIVPRGGAGWPS